MNATDMNATKKRFTFIVPLLSAIFFTIGIFAFHWSIVVIIFGYWIEEIVNIIFFILKLITTRPKEGESLKNKFFYIIALFFMSFVHFVFILIFIGILGKGSDKGELLFDNLLYLVFMKYSHIEFEFIIEFLKFFFTFFLIYGISFLGKFLKKKEYATKTIEEIFSTSIGPIIAPHLTIIFVGFVLLALKSPSYISLVFVIVKILTELLLYNRKKEEYK